MRKYYNLLNLGRSKYLSISNKRLIHQTRTITSHHPEPLLPFASSYTENLRTKYSRVTSNSHFYHNHARFSTMSTLELDKHEVDYPLDYQVTVKDRDIIRAAHGPANEYWLPQSNLDLLLPPLAAGVFFCYKKKEGDIDMSPEYVVNTLKKSLARVLSIFYPLAGEIVRNSQGEPEVCCNNNGVEFIHAQADVYLKSLDLHHPDETVKGKLVPNISCGLISVQVTELNCGSVIVACAFDHRIADGVSLNLFLVSWAELTKFKQISNIPSFRPSILNPQRPPFYDTTFDDLYLPISSLPPPPPSEEQLHSRIYYIPTESINQLQSDASSNGARRSKLQSFTAFVWKLFAHDGQNDFSKTSRMGVIVSGRKFFSGNDEKESSMLKNHFGNVLSIPYGELDNDYLRTMPLSKIANEVNEFVAKATKEEHFRGLIDWVELHRPEPAVARVYFKLQETDGEAVVVSSGQGFPIHDMSFGWGEPDFGSYHFPWGGQTGYMTTMPSVTKNGDWVVYTHLKQKHLDLIESKAPHVFIPVTNSYLKFY